MFNEFCYKSCSHTVVQVVGRCSNTSIQTAQSFETSENLKTISLFSVPCSLCPPISLVGMLALSGKTLPLHRSVGDLQINQTIGGEGPAGVWDCLLRSTRALVWRICLTRVIESVLNYYSNWRACLTVELPVKRVGQKPEPVKACQSVETRSVGLMDFSTPLRLRSQ